jgi:hypothetical protein
MPANVAQSADAPQKLGLELVNLKSCVSNRSNVLESVDAARKSASQ